MESAILNDHFLDVVTAICSHNSTFTFSFIFLSCLFKAMRLTYTLYSKECIKCSVKERNNLRGHIHSFDEWENAKRFILQNYLKRNEIKKILPFRKEMENNL